VAISFPAQIRPGAPERPVPQPGVHEWHLKFLTGEEESTVRLMRMFEQSRIELETFIRQGSLTASDQVFYRQLLDETNRIASRLNAQGAEWVSSTIPAAYSAAWRTHSSLVVPTAALEALSRDALGLIRETSLDMRARIRQAVGIGILESLSGADLRARILQTGLKNIPHWPSVEYRAGVIARTETMRAYNTGAIDAVTANGAKFVVWIASPDEATCKICLPRDEETFFLQPWSGPGDSPWPAAQPLPDIPAHPRCRCTTRAQYRNPDGDVIRPDIAPDTPPKLPADAMGGNKPPTLPPATGDFRKAVADLGQYTDLRSKAAMSPLQPGDHVDLIRQAAQTKIDGLRGFWRNVGRLDSAQIGVLTTGQKARVAAQMDAFMDLRYGIRYVDKAGMTPGLRRATVEALELIRSIAPRHVVDNPYLLSIGDKPYGAKRFGSNTLARAFLSGQIEWNPSLSKKYEGRFLRMIERGEFEVIVHEMMHTAHYQIGAYSGHPQGGFPRVRRDGAAAYDSTIAFDRNAEWRGIRSKSSGVSPHPKALAKLDDTIRQFEEAIARETVQLPGLEGMGTQPVYRGSIRNKQALFELKQKREQLQRAIDAGPDHEYFPTEYARENAMEDFAESATMYLVDPARLKKYSPDRYDYLKRYVFEGAEA
jgi:hypothetical protein